METFIVLLSIVTMVVASIILVVGMGRSLVEYNDRAQFWQAFGFGPPKKGAVISLLEQARVDAKLTDMAEALALVFEAEQNVKNKGRFLVPDGMGGSHERWTWSVEKAEQDVRRSKDHFWAMHRIAKHSGFAVTEKYGDYLPPSDASRR